MKIDLIQILDLKNMFIFPKRMTEENLEPGRIKRVRKAKTFALEFFMFLVKEAKESFRKHMPYCFNVEANPTTYEEAMKSMPSFEKKLLMKKWIL